MGSYYVDDPDSEFDQSPIPEEEYVAAILRIAARHGIEITDKMILEEIKEMWKERSSKKNED